MFAQSNWQEVESKHFEVIYDTSQSYLIPYVLKSAENALSPLMKIFKYKPSEKIVINLSDIYDFGFGSATTVPHNYIRLEIEPLEPGYESVPYNDRFQWIISHELVHIAVNDHASNIEKINRSIFGKVAPEQNQPLTIFFSLLTNFNRYTPRWHQEAIAIFMETWLNGGFGRILSSFDEMYFRSMVLNNKKFPSALKLEAVKANNSLFLETLSYLYGGRFTAYLSLKYGVDKLIKWFRTEPGDFLVSFQRKFKKIYGKNFNDEWDNFISFEKEFQDKNIKKIKSSKITEVKKLSKPAGWVSEPHLDSTGKYIIFAYHHPDHLAAIQKLNLKNGTSKIIGSLPTPSLLQVSSTAFDKSKKLFFYTTNNNQLYRDIWELNTITKEKKILFKDYRIGDLSVSSVTHDLWGIQHSNGKTALAYSPYPYEEMLPLITFNSSDELFDISVSPSGKYLAAILHRKNGEQSLVLSNCEDLKNGSSFKYENLYSKGSPENPVWDDEENFVYFNSFTNGISNIYKVNINTKEVKPISNTIKGLFKPVYLNQDSLFAFEFSTDGFIPVIIPNKEAEYLPAINYLGENVFKKNPKLAEWNLKPADSININLSNEEPYNGFKNLKLNTIIPVISGFKNEKVFGVYTNFSDPLLVHDFRIELGLSSLKKDAPHPKLHLKFKYEYKKNWEFNYEYNAQDFYDLFNKRKRGMTGTKISLANTYYWIYDNPLKVKQKSEVTYYRGVESINDNLVQVSEPDFIVAQTNFNSEKLRRSIGSTGHENGNEFNADLIAFGAKPNGLQLAAMIYGQWDYYSTFLFPHNVFHFKLAAGYNFKNDNLLQAQFFFGGFGNRIVEDEQVNQFRDVFRFPGIPIYSLNTNKFAKLMIETKLPPLWLGFGTGEHFISHLDFLLYSQALLVKSLRSTTLGNIGAQINVVLKHWFNLESTVSAGIANAWYQNGKSWDWFVSYKLLKNL